MKKVVVRAAAGIAGAWCMAASAAPTFGVADGKYAIDVPEGEEYTLTADDVATMTNEDNIAYPLAKTGGGTLVVGAVMANYPNDIYILDGQYRATAATSFGTTNGVTYVDGGTLWSTVGASSSGNAPAYGSEAFHLKGTGYNNLGAVRQTNNGCSNFAAKGGVTLDGDIRVTGTARLEFRYGVVELNGHTITVAMDSGNMFRLVALTVRNPGDVVVESGTFGIEGNPSGATAAQSVTVAAGAKLGLSNCTVNQQRTLDMAAGASISIANYDAGNPPPTFGTINDKNRWSGPISLGGLTPVSFDTPGRVLNLSAPVSGAGGFAAYGGGYVQFANTNNAFAGGVSATGVVVAATGAVTGGVAAVKTESTGNTYVAPFVAIPTNGPPVRIRNAWLGVFNARYAELPDVYADGRCSVTGAPLLVRGTLKSLTKTGADALTVYGPFHVAGATDVQGGTLRFGTRVPDVPSGLNWYYVWGVTRGSDAAGIPSSVPFRKVEPTGAAYAYMGWPSTSGANGAATHNQAHYYTGYVRIPGEEGETVTCSFITCIARYVHLRIGGTLVADQRDNVNWITGSGVTTDWNKLTVTGPFTLTAGWQTFELYLGNGWDRTAGPKIDNTALNWPYDFGVGVDWQGRCETNSANYAKFLDPGDGSFLRPTLAGKAEVDPAGYPRPSFGGAVAFGPGTTFDVGDVAPYTPVTVPSLIGVPTITNGSVSVGSSTWTLRAADVAGGAPLTVASNAALTFPAGTVTVDVADADDLRGMGVKDGAAILSAQEGASLPANAFVVSAGTKAAHWRVEPDGATLRLRRTDGLTFVIR